MNFVNEQFGRLLLAAAVLITGGLITANPPQPVEPIGDHKLKRPVLVELDKAQIAGLSNEQYFVTEAPAVTTRCVFEPEKTVFVFQPVDLDIPSASVKRPAQLLPEPGPALEGSEKLPRFGDEFPKIKLTESKGAGASGGNPLNPVNPLKPGTPAPATKPAP